MREAKKLRLGALGGLMAAGLLLAACGGGTSHAASAGTNPTTTTTGNDAGGNAGGRGGALTAFRDCMSSHGITLTLPTRPRNGNGTPPSTTPPETRPPGSGAGGLPGFGGGNFADRFETPPAGVDATKYKTALDACMSKLPTRGANAPNNSAFQAYRSCLKDHGVTFPAAGGSGGTGINRNDPKVKAALATCQPLLPAGGFGRSTTTTTIKPT